MISRINQGITNKFDTPTLKSVKREKETPTPCDMVTIAGTTKKSEVKSPVARHTLSEYFETPDNAVDKLAVGYGYSEFPQVSPDGGKVIFNVVGDYSTSQMLIMDSDGGNVRSLFTGEQIKSDQVGSFLDKSRGHISEQGVWAPDGKSVYFRTNQEGTFDIGRFDLETGERSLVAKDENLNFKHPVPMDEGHVVFYGGPPGEKYPTTDRYSNIFIADTNSGTHQQLTDSTGEVAYKHPSVMGGYILAHKEPRNSNNQNADIIRIDPESGAEVNLTRTPDADDRHPFFNKKNGLITFHSDEGGDKNIWLSTPDGKRRCQLTFYGKAAQSPCWSPDGKKIFFVKKLEKQPEGEPFYNRQADIRVVDVGDALKDLAKQAEKTVKDVKKEHGKGKLLDQAKKLQKDYRFFLNKF